MLKYSLKTGCKINIFLFYWATGFTSKSSEVKTKEYFYCEILEKYSQVIQQVQRALECNCGDPPLNSQTVKVKEGRSVFYLMILSVKSFPVTHTSSEWGFYSLWCKNHPKA